MNRTPEIIYKLDQTIKECYDNYFDNSYSDISSTINFEENLLFLIYTIYDSYSKIINDRILIKIKMRKTGDFSLYIDINTPKGQISINQTFSTYYNKNDDDINEAKKYITNILKNISEGCIKLG